MPPTHDVEGSFYPGLVLNSSNRRERVYSFGQHYYTSQSEEKINRGPLFAPVDSIGYFHLKHLTRHANHSPVQAKLSLLQSFSIANHNAVDSGYAV